MKSQILKSISSVLTFLVFISACSSNTAIYTITPSIQEIPTQTKSLDLVATQIIGIPQDAVINVTCRITINFFFNFKKGDDPKPFRNLFIESSQYLADSYRAPVEAYTLIDITPASKWWQNNFPSTPIPGAYLPEKQNEYIYEVLYTGHYDPNTTPAFAFPISMTMRLVSDDANTCKIKNFGGG